MRTLVLLALLLALFAVLFVPALAQEGDDEGPLDPTLNEGEEVIEEIDTESAQQQAGGRPQMSPEEMERQQKLYQEMIEYVMSQISEPCQGELQTALSTPPEQQTPDMLSAECKGPVNAAAADFQKRKAGEQGGSGAEGSDGEGGPAKNMPAVEAAPLATYVTILAGALLPLLACCGFAYVSESNKARKLAKLREEDPAAYAREKEEEERKKRREEKKAEKMRRKGKAPVAESE